jgi:hypothetical protein
MYVNTEEFRRTALHFEKNKYYTAAIPGTKAYYDFWDEEARRCMNGYSVGGMRITGFHYFYLNYCPILRVEDKYLITKQKGASKSEHLPAFWDGDYNYFWALEIAKHGIRSPHDPDLTISHDEKVRILHNLDLSINIDTNSLDGGKHFVVLKARGKGYSYKAGAVLARNFNLGTNSKNYGIADDKTYLIEDGVLSKAFETVNFVDHNTAWTQPRLKDTELFKRAGYKLQIGGTDVERGRNNQIIGVSTKNNPNKARGKRGDIILFEEAGKFPNLLPAWEICRSSVEQGAYVVGTMIAYGTGGTEEADYEGLEMLFYDPDTYNVLPMENIWDDGKQGTTCAFFVPAWQNWEGYMDGDGNSLEADARGFLDSIREQKKQARDTRALEQYTSENPYTPQEATLRVTANVFPTHELTLQLNHINITGIYKSALSGLLMENASGQVEFKPVPVPKPILDYPTKAHADLTGAISIVETPIRIGGQVPHGLYIIGHDPYAHDQSSGDSLGSAYVIKMANPFSRTYNDCIVAWYVGRPATQDDFNKNLFNLARYYNAKIGFENDRGDVIAYARRHRMLHYLEEEFKMLDKRQLASSKVRRNYGMHMTPNRKAQGELYIRDWLNTKISTADDGSMIKVLHTILDPALLTELIKYNIDGNFDRVMAIMVAMYHVKELTNREVVARINDPIDEFFKRDLFV